MRSIRTRVSSRRAGIVAAAAGLLVVGVAATALAATGSPSSINLGSAHGTPAVARSTASPSASAAPHACSPGIGRLLQGTPGAMKSDLKKLHDAAKKDKPAARAQIRKDALAGEYGTRDRALTHAVTGATATPLPAALRTDLKALRALPHGSTDRPAKVAAIWDKALDGGYGSMLETRAKTVHAALQKRCAASS